MAVHLTYVSDQRFLHHRGRWYTTASFPLEAMARGLGLGAFTFFGRLDETDDPSRLFALDAPPGLALRFEGPRGQPPGPWGHLRGVAASVDLRRAARAADVLWLKLPTTLALLALPHRRAGQVVVSQQVGDAVEGLALAYPRWRALGRVLAWSCRHAAETADVASFVSRALADRYGRGRAGAIVASESRVPEAALLAAPLPRPPRFEVAFVGRLAPEKCVDDLLHAVAGAPGIAVRVVGDGPERPALEALARDLGLGERATFTGAVPWGPALFAELRRCAALALPSATEGLPLVLVEAMSQALPVVATRVGGVPELVDDGRSGLLVEVHRPDQLADALRRLASDEALRLRLARGALQAARAQTVERQLAPLLARVAAALAARAPVPARSVGA